MTRKTGTKFQSGIAEAVHEMASGLHRIGLIDQETMREFDASCLTAVEPLTPEEISNCAIVRGSARECSRDI